MEIAGVTIKMKHKPIANNEGRIANPNEISDLEAQAMADEILAKAQISPGTWHELGEVKKSAEEFWDKPQYTESLIKIYQRYEQDFGRPRSVFYPACGIDASPLRGFPNSEIVFLDPDASSVKVMQNAGIPILHQGMEQYSGGKHDLIILLNPQGFSPSLVLPYMEKDGKIMANNWTGRATTLKRLGLPILARYDTKGDEVISIPMDVESFGDPYVVFGGRK